MSTSFSFSQNDQSTGEIKVIGGDDLSTLTGKVRNMKENMIMTKIILVDSVISTINKHRTKISELEMRNTFYCSFFYVLSNIDAVFNKDRHFELISIH